MKVFISGGCKNGKSSYAEKIAALLSRGSRHLYYVAAMIPGDAEDEERIARHRAGRAGLGFETVEIPLDIENVTNECDINGVILLESLTALLANEMFSRDGVLRDGAHEKISQGLLKIIKAVENVVIVSDFIYSDAGAFDRETELYRKALAGLDRLCADNSDVVVEACCGNLIVYKGGEEFGEIFEQIV